MLNPLARVRLSKNVRKFLDRPAVKYVTSSLHAAQEKIGRGLDRVSEAITPSSKTEGSSTATARRLAVAPDAPGGGQRR